MNINIYAKIVGGIVEDLILPDEKTMQFKAIPTGENWFGVQWPLNPHFTGISGIRIIIEASFKNRQPINQEF